MSAGKKKRRGTILVLLCIVIILSCVLYLITWNAKLRQAERKAEEYASLYAATAAPTDTPEPTDVPEPTDTPEPKPTFVLTVSSTETATEAPTAEPTEAPIEAPTEAPTAEPYIVTMPTEPPVNEKFSSLLEINPETIGYLKAGKIEYPVVQKKNDNEYYLKNSFECQPDSAGAVFMDGSNLLVPEDDCLILYGHNMKNGTMFARLRKLEDLESFREFGLARFDTLYEDRLYVPFAVFEASVDPENEDYFEIRRFTFADSEAFEAYVSELTDRTLRHVDVDVAYGDKILLMVTCRSTSEDMRVVVALRALRAGESAEEMENIVRNAS